MPPRKLTAAEIEKEGDRTAVERSDPHHGEIGWYDDEGEWHEGLKPLQAAVEPHYRVLMMDLAEETNLAVIRERVRNGTSDFQDARWLLGIVDKLLG